MQLFESLYLKLMALRVDYNTIKMLNRNQSPKKGNLSHRSYQILRTVDERFQIMDIQLDQSAFDTINVCWDLDLKEVLLGKVVSKAAILDDIRHSANKERTREIHSNALKNQIHLLGRLKHQNILRMEQHAENVQYLYLFFQYCPRGHLQAILQKQGGLGYQQTMPLWRQLLKATAFLHRSKIVHRDIRPRNIYINEKGKIKLTNFKSACNLDELTSSHDILLERSTFTAPQAFAGLRVSPKMDVWSLGVILFYMLFGCSPWPGVREGDWHRRLPSSIVFPDDADIPERIKLFIGKMLIYDADLRISSDELVNAFGG